MIRISLGLEHIDDIIHDFEQAFAGAGLTSAEGWTPTWKKDMEGKDWNDGTLYAPKPVQESEKVNGTANGAVKEVVVAS